MARCGRPRRASARRSVMKAQASTPRRRQGSSTLMVAAEGAEPPSGRGAVGDPPGNDGVPESALGFVVGGGQLGMGDEGGDGGPVVEHLAGERPDLFSLVV